MSQEHQSVSEKVHELADRIDEKLEPDADEQPHRPVNDASDPFSPDQRPDETGHAHGSVAGVEQ